MKLFKKEITVSNKKEAAIATATVVGGAIATAFGLGNAAKGTKALLANIAFGNIEEEVAEDSTEVEEETTDEVQEDDDTEE